MQYASYSQGKDGYALHKMHGYWAGVCSGYFAADGTLKDAEQITGRWERRSRPVKVNGPMWKELQRIGRAYRTNPQQHAIDNLTTAGIAVGRNN